jgi:SAM-dependent methyltransferase
MKEYYDTDYARSQLDLDERGNTFAKIADVWQETKTQMRILDIGCGAGSVCEQAVQMGHLVYGLDIMQEAVRRADQKGLKARVHDVNQGLPFEDRYFDCILALDILEHLFDPLALLHEIRRVLAGDGYAIIFLPLHFDLRQRLRMLNGKGIVLYEHLEYNPNYVAWRYFHVRFFTLQEAQDFVAIGGFRIQQRVFRPIFTADMKWPFNFFLNRRITPLLANKLPSLFASGLKMVVRPL